MGNGLSCLPLSTSAKQDRLPSSSIGFKESAIKCPSYHRRAPLQYSKSRFALLGFVKSKSLQYGLFWRRSWVHHGNLRARIYLTHHSDRLILELWKTSTSTNSVA